MRRSPAERFGPDPLALADDMVDRLTGGLAPADAPPAYAPVAALLAEARRVVASTAPPMPAGLLSGMAAQLAAAAPTPSPRTEPPRRRHMLSKLVPVKIGALAAGAVLAAGGVAAAATGSLPAPVQDAVSSAADTVGVSVPAATDTTTSGATDGTTTGATDGTTTGSTTGSTDGTATGSTDGTGTTSSTGGTSTVQCPDGLKNHGQYVSSVAHSGGDVVAAAHSDCGKKADAADDSSEDATDASGDTSGDTSGSDTQATGSTDSTATSGTAAETTTHGKGGSHGGKSKKGHGKGHK